MLKGISPLLSPRLLATLCRMGHGDEIILADAHFPAHSHARLTLRADGCGVEALLRALLPLFELDSYDGPPAALMAPVAGDESDPVVERAYRRALDELAPGTPDLERLERGAFYDRARTAFAVVQTGDTTPYGNLLLRKGVTPT